jgi:hypothetical protein
MKTKNYQESAEYMNSILIQLGIEGDDLMDAETLECEECSVREQEEFSVLDEHINFYVNSFILGILEDLEKWRTFFLPEQVKWLKQIIENKNEN